MSGGLIQNFSRHTLDKNYDLYSYVDTSEESINSPKEVKKGSLIQLSDMDIDLYDYMMSRKFLELGYNEELENARYLVIPINVLNNLYISAFETFFKFGFSISDFLDEDDLHKELIKNLKNIEVTKETLDYIERRHFNLGFTNIKDDFKEYLLNVYKLYLRLSKALKSIESNPLSEDEYLLYYYWRWWDYEKEKKEKIETK